MRVVENSDAALKANITLDDYTVARLTRDSFRTTTIDNVPITPQIRELEFDLSQIDLGSYEHYMLKEICEQPQALRQSMKDWYGKWLWGYPEWWRWGISGVAGTEVTSSWS